MCPHLQTARQSTQLTTRNVKLAMWDTLFTEQLNNVFRALPSLHALPAITIPPLDYPSLARLALELYLLKLTANHASNQLQTAKFKTHRILQSARHVILALHFIQALNSV